MGNLLEQSYCCSICYNINLQIHHRPHRGGSICMIAFLELLNCTDSKAATWLSVHTFYNIYKVNVSALADASFI